MQKHPPKPYHLLRGEKYIWLFGYILRIPHSSLTLKVILISNKGTSWGMLNSLMQDKEAKRNLHGLVYIYTFKTKIKGKLISARLVPIAMWVHMASSKRSTKCLLVITIYLADLVTIITYSLCSKISVILGFFYTD